MVRLVEAADKGSVRVGFGREGCVSLPPGTSAGGGCEQEIVGENGGEERAAYRINVKGTVQGVGFRPFVFNLARKHALNGWVLNSSAGVRIEIEGKAGSAKAFIDELKANPPRLAKIEEVLVERVPPSGWEGFEIRMSDSGEEKELVIPPDVALCEDCRRELLDPADRRYLYPFTNCTNCGPRFTIIEDIPYDRPNTSMRKFRMCEKCGREYNDPSNRRFHAQPNACPVCGPRVTLTDRLGKLVTSPGAGGFAFSQGANPDGGGGSRDASEGWIRSFRELIKAGKIVAIKGLGGFHLACDPRSEKAVMELRLRKKRPARPFAVMCRDVEVAMRYCAVGPEERELLESPEAPIVILERRKDFRAAAGEGGAGHERAGPHPKAGEVKADGSDRTDMVEAVAPKLNTLGVMLPYTPLHTLLFDDEIDILVMTSGNLSELPLAKDNEEAFRDLGGVADLFLIHDREIVRRCDDSLVRVIDGETHFYRRSRGYVPRPIRLGIPPSKSPVLGVGGEMKNVFCLLRGNEAFLSQHIGEMDHKEGVENFLRTYEDLSRMLGIRPAIVAYDMHPGYHSAVVARGIHAGRYIAVQHHHAHMGSVMAENGLEGPVVGVIADGTGYGSDGRVWGFEILLGGYESFARRYHLRYVPMPGGERAVRFPWLMALSYLRSCLGEEGVRVARKLFPREREMDIALTMLEKGLNCPLTSGCGRLFDAVSAILGICHENTYEGQAAVELGELAAGCLAGREGPPVGVTGYPFQVCEGSGAEAGTIDPSGVIRGIVRDLENGIDLSEIALRFHVSVAEMMVRAAELSARPPGLDPVTNSVVLSGGSFQNPLLFRMVRDGLTVKGLQPYYHRRVPANDAGIALGQAVIATRICDLSERR